jgi:hypothetical protein
MVAEQRLVLMRFPTCRESEGSGHSELSSSSTEGDYRRQYGRRADCAWRASSVASTKATSRRRPRTQSRGGRARIGLARSGPIWRRSDRTRYCPSEPDQHLVDLRPSARLPHVLGRPWQPVHARQIGQ